MAANANEGFLARVAQTTGVPKIPNGTEEAAPPQEEPTPNERSSLDEEIRAREAELAELEALTSQVAQLDASGEPGDTAAMAATAKELDAVNGSIAELEAQAAEMEASQIDVTSQSTGEDLERGGDMYDELQAKRAQEQNQQEEDAALFAQAEAAAAAEGGRSPAAAPPPQSSPFTVPTTRYDNMMPAGLTSFGGTSQVRVYEQLLELRQRMNQRLSESNKYARFLEGELSRRDVQVKTAQTRMKMMARESRNLAGITEELTNLTKFATDPAMVVSRIESLGSRLRAMEELLAGDIEGLDKVSLITVPIAWMGVAGEVKLMGDFDNWTRGVELSPEDYNYSGEQVFSAEVDLLPGEYECKFVVDGEWRLGNGWPATMAAPEDQNSLLQVAPGVSYNPAS